MLTRLRAGSYASARGLRSLVEAPSLPLVCVLALSVCALLFGLVALVWVNVVDVVGRWGVDVPITVFADEHVGALEMGALAEQMRALPEVESVELVSRGQAWERLEASFGEDTPLLRDVTTELMPTMLEIELADGVDDAFSTALVAKLDAHPAVREVVGAEAWSREVQGAVSVLETVVAVVGVLVIIAGLLIVWCTIRLSVDARQTELRVLRLVGATGAFVRGSFQLAGALQGAVAVAIALAGLWWGFEFVRVPIDAGLGWMLAGDLRFFNPGECWLGVGLGALLGVLGSHAATSRYVHL